MGRPRRVCALWRDTWWNVPIDKEVACFEAEVEKQMLLCTVGGASGGTDVTRVFPVSYKG